MRGRRILAEFSGSSRAPIKYWIANFSPNNYIIKMKKENGFYGYIAGIVSAGILQPLENMKMALMVPPKDLPLSNNFAKNLLKVCPYLWNQGKVQGFYRGLVPNVMKTGSSSAVYFYSLRSLEHLFNEKNFVTTFFVSSFSRVLGAIASNPLTIIKTRFELAGENRWKGPILDNLIRLYKI